MRRAFVMVSVMLVLLSAPMLLPSVDADDVVGTELYHSDGTLYTEDDTMVNGRVESNYDRGTYIVPDESKIPLDDSYIVIRVKTAGDISMQFTYTGAAQFLTQVGIKVCIHSDHERTQLVAEATATNGQEADFLKEGTLALLESDKNYYISMYTSGEARVNAIPEETGITFIFKATLDTDFHVVSFDSNGGTPSGIPDKYVAEGQPLGDLQSVSRSGYIFDGWYNGSTKVTSSTIMGTEDMHLKAQWISDPYETFSLSYDANGGTGAPPTEYKEGIGSVTFTVSSKIPEKEGYGFLGWSLTRTGTVQYVAGDRITVSSSTTLYAVWTDAESHTLYFDGNGGIPSERSRSVREGMPYGTLPTAECTDYSLTGWFDAKEGGNQVSSSTKMGDSDTTIYAQWKFSGEEHEDTKVEVLPDGSIKTTYTDVKIHSDGSVETLVEITIEHPDGTVDFSHDYDYADKDGDEKQSYYYSTFTDAEGKSYARAFERYDEVSGKDIATKFDGKDSLDSVIGSDVIDSEIMDAVLRQIEEGKEFLSEYSVKAGTSVSAEIRNTLRVNSDALASLDELGCGLYILGDAGDMYLDDDVISAAAGSGEDVFIIIEKGTPENLTPAQMKVIGDNYSVVVTMKRGGTVVHDIGGTATISLEPGLKENVFIYYIQEDGSHEIVESSYDQKTGEVRFVVDHFSVYMATGEDIDSKDNGFPWWIPLVIAIIVLAMLLAVIYHRRS